MLCNDERREMPRENCRDLRALTRPSRLAWSSFTAPMKMSETSSRPLRFTVKLRKLLERLSQPSMIRGSMSMHWRVCKFLNACKGRAFSMDESFASSAMSFGSGA